MPPEPPFESVLTMTEFFDGPRRGIAYFRGTPHFYESKWVDIDSEAEDEFVLTPLSSEIVSAALEDWAIWLWWEEAFHRGDVGQDSHPSLSVDRARHEELTATLAPQLKSDPRPEIRVRGEFRVPADSSKQFGARELEVRWTECESGG